VRTPRERLIEASRRGGAAGKGVRKGGKRLCQVCGHPQRAQIDRCLCTGVAKERIAARFRVTRYSVAWHANHHLTPEMRAAIATRVLEREDDLRATIVEEGASLIDSLKAVRSPLFSLFLNAVDSLDGRVAAALAGRLHENMSIAAKLTGEIAPHATMSITNILAQSRLHSHARAAARRAEAPPGCRG
jgi:hypothetical protein